jgi:hypothetical protein
MHLTRRSTSSRHAVSRRFTWTTLAPATLGVALLAGASCSTEEIGPDELAVTAIRTDGQGFLLVVLAPDADTYEQDQARIVQEGPSFVQYGIQLDGRRLIDDNGGMPWPLSAGEGNETGCGYLPAGTHHFALIAPSDGHAVFAGDYELLSGRVNHLYVFGHLAALQGAFTSYPYAPSPGTQHLALTNLLRTGQTLEVVSCSGGDPETCAAISPPVGYGQSFATEVAGADVTADGVSLETPGPGLGYRQVATPGVPTPPANHFDLAIDPPDQTETIPGTYPANYVSAPIFMSADGSIEESFD